MYTGTDIEWQPGDTFAEAYMALILWCVEHSALTTNTDGYPFAGHQRHTQDFLFAVVLIGLRWWQPLWQQDQRPWRVLWLLNQILATLEIHRLLQASNWKPKAKEWNEWLRQSLDLQLMIDWEERQSGLYYLWSPFEARFQSDTKLYDSTRGYCGRSKHIPQRWKRHKTDAARRKKTRCHDIQAVDCRQATVGLWQYINFNILILEQPLPVRKGLTASPADLVLDSFERSCIRAFDFLYNRKHSRKRVPVPLAHKAHRRRPVKKYRASHLSSASNGTAECEGFPGGPRSVTSDSQIIPAHPAGVQLQAQPPSPSPSTTQPTPPPKHSAYHSSSSPEQLVISLTVAMRGEQGASFTITCFRGSVDCTNWSTLHRRYALTEISVYAGAQRTFSGDLKNGMRFLKSPGTTSITVHDLQYNRMVD